MATMTTRPQDRRRAERVNVDWTARLEAGTGVLEGPVVDVSTRGLRFAAGEALPGGTAGTLVVTFLGNDQRMEVVELHATVVWCGHGGVAVTYGELPEIAARRLRARFLSAELRRRTPRVRVVLRAELQTAGGPPAPTRTVDLSAFAARVEAPLPLVPGTRMDLTLFPEDGRPALTLKTVAWEMDGAEAVLMFTNLSSRDFDRIGDWVVSLLQPSR